MLVFIDESGDSGMKGKPGSSRLFVVTAILIEENEDVEECDGGIAALKRELKLSEKFEFHFNSCSNEFRRRFLGSVVGSNFFYYSIVLNKAKLWGEGFKYKDSFYKYAAGLVFENAKSHLIEATVVLDQCGNRDFRKQLSKYLRKRMNEGKRVVIKKVRMEASHSNNPAAIGRHDLRCGKSLVRHITREQDGIQEVGKLKGAKSSSVAQIGKPASLSPCGERAPYGDSSVGGRFRSNYIRNEEICKRLLCAFDSMK